MSDARLAALGIAGTLAGLALGAALLTGWEWLDRRLQWYGSIRGWRADRKWRKARARSGGESV